MTTRLLSFLIIVFASCSDNCKDIIANNPTNDKTSPIKLHIDSILERKNSQLCDTCISTLIVSHHECTECKDVQVDSGTIFISLKVLHQFDSTHLKRGGYSKLNTMELYFDDRKDFIKLWSDTILNENFSNIYRVTCKITRYDIALRLKIISFVKLDRK